jgi:FkbM family methyltransferase
MGLKRTVTDGVRSIAPPSVFNYARRVYHWLGDMTVRPHVETHVYGGVPLSVHIENRGAQGWYTRDWQELREIQLLSKGRLRPGATVFDIGAHHAIVAMMLGHIVGPAGKVVAVEASSAHADTARRNIALNRVQNVTLIEAAADSESGQRSFTPDSDSIDRGEPGMGKIVVKALSVDDLTAEFGQPDVLFIDVEGFECKVLGGASNTLRGRPDLFIEVHVGVGLEEYGDSVEDVVRLIPPGYEISMAAPDGEFRPLDKTDDVTRQRFFLVARFAASAARL